MEPIVASQSPRHRLVTMVHPMIRYIISRAWQKKKKEDAHCFVGMKVVASDVMAHEFTRKKDVGEIEVEVARR